MGVHRNLKPYACCGEHSVIFAMWIQCVGQVYIVCAPLEDQFYMGSLCVATDQSMDQSYGSCAKDQSYGDTMQNLIHVQRTNPMGQCM